MEVDDTSASPLVGSRNVRALKLGRAKPLDSFFNHYAWRMDATQIVCGKFQDGNSSASQALLIANVLIRRGFASKVDFGENEFCLIRVTSWIVSFVPKTKDDPRSHTNQHEAKHSCLVLTSLL